MSFNAPECAAVSQQILMYVSKAHSSKNQYIIYAKNTPLIMTPSIMCSRRTNVSPLSVYTCGRT